MRTDLEKKVYLEDKPSEGSTTSSSRQLSILKDNKSRDSRLRIGLAYDSSHLSGVVQCTSVPEQLTISFISFIDSSYHA